MSWAVVRVRGSINVNPKIKETMKLMRLNLRVLKLVQKI